MNNKIQTPDDSLSILKLIAENEIVILYFSHDECNVCKVLKPKLASLLEEKYPKVRMMYVNINDFPEIAGQNRVFTVPTILVFISSKENMRFSRNISLFELDDRLEKYYNMIY